VGKGHYSIANAVNGRAIVGISTAEPVPVLAGMVREEPARQVKPDRVRLADRLVKTIGHADSRHVASRSDRN
jgi:hypothetical protein